MLDTAMKDYLYVSELGRGRGGLGWGPEPRKERTPQPDLSLRMAHLVSGGPPGPCVLGHLPFLPAGDPLAIWLVGSELQESSGQPSLGQCPWARSRALQGQVSGGQAGLLAPRPQSPHPSSQG